MLMRVLSRLAGWMLGAALVVGCSGEGTGPTSGLPAVGRPPGASQGPRVAVVVAFRGTVTVEPSPLGEGATFPAVPELQLLRDDRLVVGPDSFVLVALHNGHVVRLNAGASLRVDAMATFDDPPAGTDLEESFARLLSPSERGDAELRGAITRVAGWNTRMSAAETVAPQPPQAPPLMQRPSARIEDDARPVTQDPADASGAEQPSGQVAADRPMDSLGAAGTVEPPQRRSPTAKDDAPSTDDTDVKKPTGSPPAAPSGGSTKPGDKNNDKAKAEPEAESTSSEKPSPPRSLDLPKIVVHRSDDGKLLRVSLPGPFVVVRAELASCAGPGAQIRGRIAGKKLVELRIGASPTKCVPGLIGKAVALTDGWIEMTVKP